MEDFKPPKKLSFEGDVATNWKEWRQMFELYMVAKESTEKPDQTKIAMLLTIMGPEGVKRFNHFAWSQSEDKDKYNDVINKFNVELSGEKREVFNRYQFWDHKRTEHQGFEDFYTELKFKASKCDFMESDKMIRDKIVFSVTDKRLKERLLREKDLDLQRTVVVCRAAEITQQELQSMSRVQQSDNIRSAAQVDTVKKRPSRVQDKPSSSQSASPTSPNDSAKHCSRCKRTHGPSLQNDCPAWGKTCYKCSGTNHFALCCRSKRMYQVDAEDVSYNSDQSDEYFFGAIEYRNVGSVSHEPSRVWFEKVKVCGSHIKMKVDTGAETNSIPQRTWRKITDRPDLVNSNVILRAFGGAVVEHTGRATVPLCLNGQSVSTEIFVTKQKTVPILGLQASVALGLVNPPEVSAEAIDTKTDQDTVHVCAVTEPITWHTLETEYRQALEGNGIYEGKCNITLQENSPGFIEPAHRIPHKLLKPLEAKLKEMVENKVIAPVEGPTDFVNNLVITEKKDGSLRLCLDPKHLNEQIKREHFQIPTFEDIAAKIGGKKVFTVIDQKDSYWQVELDEESAPLTTFSTPFGRYMFLRMPFGITSAAEVLQKKTYQVFGGIKDTHVIADDMLIASDNDQEHDETIRTVLETAIENNVKFRLRKTQLKQPRVSYYGHSVGSDGLKPDLAKIQAIVDMPEPCDQESLKRLMGMLNFLSPFIPNKSSLVNPMSSLLKTGVP